MVRRKLKVLPVLIPALPAVFVQALTPVLFYSVQLLIPAVFLQPHFLQLLMNLRFSVPFFCFLQAAAFLFHVPAH